MTTPGPGDQWPNPQQGGYPPPGGQYGNQPYGGPPPQPGGYPQQGYPQQYAPTNYQQPPGAAYQQPGGVAVPPPPGGGGRSKRGLIIGLVVALVVAAGGVASYFAFWQRDSAAAGAATPTDAALNLANSFGDGDLVGMLSTLAPAEAALLTDPLKDSTTELKRLGILTEGADPSNFGGISLTTENLTFDEQGAEQINDHLTITKLTGGKVTLGADLANLPIADEYRDAMLAEAGGAATGGSQTIDIGQVVRETGEPIRIATVKVGDEWYPSLFYTIADNALHEEGEQWPSQPIPANGAASPNEAVQQTVQAALEGNLRRVIELLPPDEMGVLHDVGPLILDEMSSFTGAPEDVRITKLETETSEVSGGTRATITALDLELGSQGSMSLAKDGDCYQATFQGQTERLCADQLAAIVEQEADSGMPQAARDALTNLGAGVMKQGLGVVTTEVDGKHYVSPLRTFTELGMTVLRSMQPEDVQAMMEGAN